jgi:hypothetical protein
VVKMTLRILEFFHEIEGFVSVYVMYAGKMLGWSVWARFISHSPLFLLPANPIL